MSESTTDQELLDPEELRGLIAGDEHIVVIDMAVARKVFSRSH